MIVYVAEDGRDEDRIVVGVFSTQKAAEDYLAERNDGLDPISCQVSAWNLDDTKNPQVEIYHESFDR